MAKRRRLEPAQQNGTETTQQAGPLGAMPSGAGAPGRPLGLAPIARVAGEAAASAALDELSQSLRQAREEGRLALLLPFEAVEEAYLERDRIEAEAEPLAALEASLLARGQQTPIEVEALPPGPDGAERYGLISGWRRLTALRRIAARGAGPDGVLAVLRRPADAAAAYVAMVEENEIRADLSFWERARIVRRAVAGGAFADETEALRGLFASASYARRSKIKSFVALVAALDGALRFPTALSERAGLSLLRAIETTPRLAERIRADLLANPAADATEELTRLAALAVPSPATIETDANPPSRDQDARSAPVPASSPAAAAPALQLSVDPGAVTLSGPAVTPEFVARLRDWLGLPG